MKLTLCFLKVPLSVPHTHTMYTKLALRFIGNYKTTSTMLPSNQILISKYLATKRWWCQWGEAIGPVWQ